MYRQSQSLARKETIGNSQAPQETEELFLPKEWQFDHGIADFSEIEAVHKVRYHGTIESRTFWMEDGSEYHVHEARPFTSKQKLSQASIKTTAFLTRDDQGFNRHHQIKELESGLPTILISREYEWQDPLSQARTAHNMLKIGKFIVGEDDSLDDKNVQLRGISRGGMLALVATALAQQNTDYGLDSFYFSSTAPCFPRPLKLDRKYIKMPLYEASSLMYHMAKMPLNTLTHYPRTVDTNTRFAISDARALVNGDAGRALKHMSPNPNVTRGYVLGYPDDVMGMGQVWEEDFSGFPDVTVDLDADKLMKVFNGHLRAVSHDDLSDAMERQMRLVEESKRTNGNLANIDYQYVSLGK